MLRLRCPGDRRVEIENTWPRPVDQPDVAGPRARLLMSHEAHKPRGDRRILDRQVPELVQTDVRREVVVPGAASDVDVIAGTQVSRRHGLFHQSQLLLPRGGEVGLHAESGRHSEQTGAHQRDDVAPSCDRFGQQRCKPVSSAEGHDHEDGHEGRHRPRRGPVALDGETGRVGGEHEAAQRKDAHRPTPSASTTPTRIRTMTIADAIGWSRAGFTVTARGSTCARNQSSSPNGSCDR